MNACARRLLAACLFLLAAPVPAAEPPLPWPAPSEIHALLHRWAPGLPAPDPGLTNVADYLDSLAPLVLPADPATASAPALALARTNLYHPGIACLRVARVESDLPLAVTEAVSTLTQARPLAGLILDLRRAGGSDFDAAFATAGLFAREAKDGFRLGSRDLSVQPRGSLPKVPLMILVGRSTRGAAEGLAAALRAVASPGLLLGTNTAGQGRLYRDLEIRPSRALLVATQDLVLPGGKAFPREGLSPDLGVWVSAADEALYLENEFGRVVNGRRLAAASSQRLNEAELVRRRFAPRSSSFSDRPSGQPAVHDPVLARGIDLLSGLADQRSPGLAGDSR